MQAEHHHHVLQLDIQGTPQAWISIEHAASHYATGSVAWEEGEVRISANVTDDFGNVTGLEPVLELREEDCRFESNLAGLKAPRWLS